MTAAPSNTRHIYPGSPSLQAGREGQRRESGEIQSGVRRLQFSHRNFSFCQHGLTGDRGAETPPGWDNLHVGVVTRHRLDSRKTSNDLFYKKPISETHCSVRIVVIRVIPPEYEEHDHMKRRYSQR